MKRYSISNLNRSSDGYYESPWIREDINGEWLKYSEFLEFQEEALRTINQIKEHLRNVERSL